MCPGVIRPTLQYCRGIFRYGVCIEYVSTVWDPVTKSNIAKLESVKRCTARLLHD